MLGHEGLSFLASLKIWDLIRLQGEAVMIHVLMIHSEMTDVLHCATACPLRSGRSPITFAARSVLSWWGSHASHPAESLMIGKTSRSTYRSEHFSLVLSCLMVEPSSAAVCSSLLENCTFGRTLLLLRWFSVILFLNMYLFWKKMLLLKFKHWRTTLFYILVQLCVCLWH